MKRPVRVALAVAAIGLLAGGGAEGVVAAAHGPSTSPSTTRVAAAAGVATRDGVPSVCVGDLGSLPGFCLTL